MTGLKKARRKQAKAKALRGYKNRAMTPGVKKAAEPEPGPVSPFVMTTQTTKSEPTPKAPWWDQK